MLTNSWQITTDPDSYVYYASDGSLVFQYKAVLRIVRMKIRIRIQQCKNPNPIFLKSQSGPTIHNPDVRFKNKHRYFFFIPTYFSEQCSVADPDPNI